MLTIEYQIIKGVGTHSKGFKQWYIIFRERRVPTVEYAVHARTYTQLFIGMSEFMVVNDGSQS